MPKVYTNNEIFRQVADISNLTNLQQTVANKTCKKVYTT